MRILLVNPSYPPVPCGVGNYMQGLANALVEAGHEVTVLTAAGQIPPQDGPPRVLPLLREWDVTSFLRALPKFARPRPEVVVSSFPAVVPGRYSRLLYLVPVLSKLLLGRPRTVFVVHEYVRTGEAERKRLRVALKAADRIIAVTEGERDGILARHPGLAARTVVCHNPATMPAAPPDPEADARLRREIAPPDRPLVAFIGLLQAPGKGFEELLEAIAMGDAVLASTGSLEPQRNAYHAHVAGEIERLGLGERIRWLGFLDDERAGRLLRVADVVALPYRGGAESGYTSLLAALVNGAAVVTTRGDLTPPWLCDGETALLIEPQDPRGLASAIARILADELLAARLREGAWGLSFGWEGLVDAITARRFG